MILLDTSVLSAAFRRRRRSELEARAVDALTRLVAHDVPLAIPGIVLQELLGGVRHEDHFTRPESLIDPFPVIMAERRDHVAAARIGHACRRRGVSASTIDCLIAALAAERHAPLFTLDADFARMAPHCGLTLFRTR